MTSRGFDSDMTDPLNTALTGGCAKTKLGKSTAVNLNPKRKHRTGAAGRHSAMLGTQFLSVSELMTSRFHHLRSVCENVFLTLIQFWLHRRALHTLEQAWQRIDYDTFFHEKTCCR